MKCVAIIQARTNSSRLPKKILLKMYGKTILEHIVTRVKKAQNIDEVWIATTDSNDDDAVELISKKIGVQCYRGSENDVLDRYYQSALLAKADIICRITADDPFKDYQVIDQIIDEFNKGEYDYISNTIEPSYPEGIDAEVFSIQALKKAWSEAKLQSEREHVTPYIWKNPDIFKLKNIKYKEDLSSLRWTLDKPEDFVFIQQIYDYLYNPDNEEIFTMNDVLEVLKEHPELAEINKGTIRNEGYIKSLEIEGKQL